MLAIASAFSLTWLATAQIQQEKVHWQTGDIVFQYGTSESSEAIKLATGSKFSHCGILFLHEGRWLVLEAVQPVRVIPMADWMAQGADDYVEIKRVKEEYALSAEQRAKMWEVGSSYLNKDYDLKFHWSDEEMYCSELVWKVYALGAGLELCDLKPLKAYDLKHDLVQTVLKQRYGVTLPLDQRMVSPQDIFESNVLE